MKFSCTQENFHKGLEVVARVSGKNAALPILSNVLVRAESTGVLLSTTNLEIGITCRIRGKVDAAGAYTVLGRLLNDFIALLPPTRIDVALEGGALNVSTDETTTTIKGAPAEEFPLIPAVEQKNPIVVGVAALKQAITQTIFAAAYDNSRPEINGVYVRVEEKSLTLAATDSYRLAERRIEAVSQGEARSAIVPVRALQELLRILDSDATEATLYLTDNQLLVQVDDIELVSRLIEGQYPDYAQIIPKESRTHAAVVVADLARVVKSASLFCKTGINDVTLTIGTGGKIIVRAANAQLGEHQTSVSAEVTGDENTVIFNYRYLLDGLACIPTNTVRLEATDPESPGLLTPTNDQPYRYLIMPIRQ